ncbi:MAG: glutathione S-transferase N-terminal domain-containing protein, partial [Gammaproteobacteria bacterium]|nr:glutathione S-transferase N-terminal domain-containing protein [Gammaproteobacteria bacterium]
MTSGSIRLYSYWRSSAAYRVRIALNLKGLPHEIVPVHLARDGGEQHKPPFSDLNPQELVPVLLHGNRILRQSMAIMEYLDETWPTPPLMPATARDRQRVRSLAQVIA